MQATGNCLVAVIGDNYADASLKNDDRTVWYQNTTEKVKHTQVLLKVIRQIEKDRNLKRERKKRKIYLVEQITKERENIYTILSSLCQSANLV